MFDVAMRIREVDVAACQACFKRQNRREAVTQNLRSSCLDSGAAGSSLVEWSGFPTKRRLAQPLALTASAVG